MPTRACGACSTVPARIEEASPALLAAPIELADFRRLALEIPVAAAELAGDFRHEAEFHAGQIGFAQMALVDANCRPGQAIAFGRRALAEREHARTEHLAIARQDQLALERPGVGDAQLFLQIH